MRAEQNIDVFQVAIVIIFVVRCWVIFIHIFPCITKFPSIFDVVIINSVLLRRVFSIQEACKHCITSTNAFMNVYVAAVGILIIGEGRVWCPAAASDACLLQCRYWEHPFAPRVNSKNEQEMVSFAFSPNEATIFCENFFFSRHLFQNFSPIVKSAKNLDDKVRTLAAKSVYRKWSPSIAGLWNKHFRVLYFEINWDSIPNVYEGLVILFVNLHRVSVPFFLSNNPPKFITGCYAQSVVNKTIKGMMHLPGYHLQFLNWSSKGKLREMDVRLVNQFKESSQPKEGIFLHCVSLLKLGFP